MNSPIHILHVEDNEADAELIGRTLKAAGIDGTVTLVQGRHEFVAELERGGVDLVLSDYSLPDFDGRAVIEVTRALCPDLPLIIVSGTLGEERAVEALKGGATDYVLKDGLMRLGPAVRRAMREVTERVERRRLEAQFIESQKMEAIGQLAGGVAHDFNNILAVIMGSSEWIAAELGPASPLLKYTDEIRNASKRAAGLTRQLLVFGRKEAEVASVLNLNDVLQELDNMLRRLIGENIALTVAPGEHLGRIKANSGYLGQLLMNLAVNARDAMPNGGQLTITTSNVVLDEEHARRHPGAPRGEHVMLRVCDTGTGMTEAVKARLFEAFFTTKPKGKGTGLGLATCHAIIQRSGGHISVDSEPGRGTAFKVYFPRVEQAPPVAVLSVEAGPLPRGTETLLVVEDEPSVRNLACAVLKSLGYGVLAAADGQEGLRVAREHRGPPIRLVITDVVMPVMGGLVMAEWLKTTLPEIKILFTSGYSDEAVARQGGLEAGAGFLPKPYVPASLAAKVREMLDGPPPPDAT